MAFIQNYNAQDDKTETTGSTTGENVAPIISSGIAPDPGDTQLTATPTTSQQAQGTFGTLSNYLSNAQSNNVNNTASVSPTTGIPSQITTPDVNGVNPVGGTVGRRTAHTTTDDVNGNPITTGSNPTTQQPKDTWNPNPAPAESNPIITPTPIATPVAPPAQVSPNPTFNPAPIIATPVPAPQPVQPIRRTNPAINYNQPHRPTQVINVGKQPIFGTLQNYLGRR